MYFIYIRGIDNLEKNIMPIKSVEHKPVAHTASNKTVHKNSEIGNVPMTGNQNAKSHTPAAKTSFVEQTFNKDIKSGKLKQNEINFETLGFKVTKKLDSYTYKPAKGETYGDIKKHYKLEDGSLKTAALGDGYSGDLDGCIPKDNVIIDGEAIRMAIAASKEK